MSAELTRKRIADDLVEISVETAREAQALARALRKADLAEDVVAGLTSVCVRFHPDRTDRIEAWLSAVSKIDVQPASSQFLIEIGIRYGGEHGPDLEAVCEALGLSPTAFIAMHTEQMHTVEMIGFTPGFSYISGLPDDIEVPRLNHPRPRVAAGAVGVSGAYTGIYALPGPGGWPLIGHTAEQLFIPESDTPFRLQPGQRLKFKAI